MPYQNPIVNKQYNSAQILILIIVLILSVALCVASGREWQGSSGSEPPREK
jgi:hypothetical protein